MLGVPGAIEERVRISFLGRAEADEVLQRVYPGPGDIGVSMQIPVRIDDICHKPHKIGFVLRIVR